MKGGSSLGSWSWKQSIAGNSLDASVQPLVAGHAQRLTLTGPSAYVDTKLFFGTQFCTDTDVEWF